MIVDLKLTGDTGPIEAGIKKLSSKLRVSICDDGTNVFVKKSDNGLQILKTDSGYTLSYSQQTEFYRAIAILADGIRKNKDITLTESSPFETRGMMLDVSRGFVYKKEIVFDLIERMAIMGLNMFMLYTEDTYKIEEYPWFGYLKGGYTKEELKEFDDYAYSLGIELIPCIQTLAHLKTSLRWPAMSSVRDTADVLLVGADETYRLIEEMFKTTRECFRTNRIHIGFDEAFDIGEGKYRQLNGKKSAGDIMTEHLNEVYRLIKKYNYHPMIWSDMFFRLSGQTGEYDLAAEIPESLATTLPEDIEMIYWNYTYEDEKVTDTVLKMHNIMKRPVGLASGIWTWNKFSACYKKSYDISRNQIAACVKNGISTVFTTIWNNDNSYGNLCTMLTSLQMWAELCYDPSADEAKIASRFEACSGYDFYEWKLLSGDDFDDEEREKLNPKGHWCINTTFQLYFNDVLFGLLDKTFSVYDFETRYKSFADAMDKIDAGDMQYVFDRQNTLYKICYHKAGIASNLRNAYKNDDKARLSDILDELKLLRGLYNDFINQSRYMWYHDSKPYGNVRLENTLGGPLLRVDSAIYRLEGYLDGTVDKLEELDEEIFYYRDIDAPLLEFASPLQILI